MSQLTSLSYLSSGVKMAFVLALGGIGGGGLDDMVLKSCCVACCFVNFELEVGVIGDARVGRQGY